MKHFELLFVGAWLVLGCSGCSGSTEAPDGGAADATPLDGGRADSSVGMPCTTSTECDDGLYCNGAETCTTGHCSAGGQVCDDHLACTLDVCSEAMRTCIARAPDVDGDGHGDAHCVDGDGNPFGDDCDDTDADAYPGNVEVCDDHDDDCNPATRGGTDEDGDGFESRSCCNPDATGMLRCGTDCEDTIAATHPGATEVCDGFDQDCDAVVDDIVHGTVFCRSGQMEPCTTTCGSLAGMRSCGADCLTWGACEAAEVCNGCDDDRDGQADDGFACVASALSPCMTGCGTAGTSTCGADCTVGACRAAETCNFCDDDGANGIGDEFPLATASDIVRELEAASLTPPIAARVAGSATMTAIPMDGGADYYVQLLDGTTANAVGAYWIDLNRLQGWGPTTIHATLQVRSRDGGFPMGGWSVVVATGGSGDVGTAQNNGVPDGLTGAHFDWVWGFPFMGFPSAGDRMAYGSFPLPSWRGETNLPSSVVQFGLPVGGPDFDTGQTSYLTQELSIYYQPENTYTVPREERVEIRFPTGPACTTAASCGFGQACIDRVCNDVHTYVPDASSTTIDPDDDVPVGSQLSIGITAGSWTMSFTAAGGTRTASATVDARLFLSSFRPPPVGSGLPPTTTVRSSVLRSGLCPGF